MLDDHLKRVKRRWPETFLKLLHKLRIDSLSYGQFEQELKHEADRQFEWRSQNCRELFEEEAELRRSEAVKYLDNIVNTPAVPKKWPTKEKLGEEERMIEDSVENLPDTEAKTRREYYSTELDTKHRAEADLLIQQEIVDRRKLFTSLPKAMPA